MKRFLAALLALAFLAAPACADIATNAVERCVTPTITAANAYGIPSQTPFASLTSMRSAWMSNGRTPPSPLMETLNPGVLARFATVRAVHPRPGEVCSNP
jgi:hypothetical protein